MLVVAKTRAASRALHAQFEGQLPDELIHAQLARMKDEGRPAAERKVRESLLLEAVASAREIQVADDEVDDRLAAMAEARGMDARAMIQAAREQQFYEAVRAELLDDKVLDGLGAEAKVEEKSDT